MCKEQLMEGRLKCMQHIILARYFGRLDNHCCSHKITSKLFFIIFIDYFFYTPSVQILYAEITLYNEASTYKCSVFFQP